MIVQLPNLLNAAVIANSWRLMPMETASYFLIAANILYLICYGVRDVLWLRIFCVTGMCTILPYYFWGEPRILLTCISWNVAFLLINLFWIVVIIRQRRPPKMTEHQKRLFADVFAKSCTPQEMLKLLSIAYSETAAIGGRIVERSSFPNGLMLIDQGTAHVFVGDNLVAKLGRGDFIAEMNYLTGEPAVADVVAATPLKYLRWSKTELEKLFSGRPELKSALNEIVGRNLVSKLTSAEFALPELSVDSVISELT